MVAFLFRLAANEEDMPLIQELWQYFYNTYYQNDVYYGNLNLDTGDMIMIKNILLGLFIGLSLAAFATVFNKRVLGNFVRKLLADEVLCAENAKTLAELGYDKKYAIRSAVGHSTNLRRVVKCREEEIYNAEIEEKRLSYEEQRKPDRSLRRFRSEPFHVDPLKHHFYIPEDMKYTADIKFEKKGTTLLGAILFVVIMAIAFVVLIVSLPGIFTVLDDFVGSLGGSKTVI